MTASMTLSSCPPEAGDHAAIALRVFAGIERCGVQHVAVAAALKVHPVTLARQIGPQLKGASPLTLDDEQIIVGVLSELAKLAPETVRELMTAHLPPGPRIRVLLATLAAYESARRVEPRHAPFRHPFAQDVLDELASFKLAHSTPRAGGVLLTRLGRRTLTLYGAPAETTGDTNGDNNGLG